MNKLQDLWYRIENIFIKLWPVVIILVALVSGLIVFYHVTSNAPWWVVLSLATLVGLGFWFRKRVVAFFNAIYRP